MQSREVVQEIGIEFAASARSRGHDDAISAFGGSTHRHVDFQVRPQSG